MDSTWTVLLVGAVLTLFVLVGVQGRRLARLRRRAKRSMLIGPESFVRLQKQFYDQLARRDCAARGVTPAIPLEFRSEWGEDVLLYDLFFGLPLSGAGGRGVFIEVGANDGRSISVSWVFEALGWTGLLVEPIPERCEECRARRPGSFVLQAALGPKGSQGTTTLLVPELFEQQFSAYREESDTNARRTAELARAKARMRPVTVPYMSMDAALDLAGFDRVDFAAIDVEGSEHALLQGFDLDRFRPRVLVVEDFSFGEDPRVPGLITARGYEAVMWIGANQVYVRKDDTELLARARRASETVYSPFVRPRGHTDTAAHDLK